MKAIKINSIDKVNELKRFLKNHKRFVHTGNLAEYWCEQLCGITLSKKPNEKGFDGKYNGEKVEIKYRSFKGDIPPGMKINLKGISYVYYVLLDEDLFPNKIYRYKSKDIEQRNNSRVSFKQAHDNNSVKIVFPKID